MLILLIVLIVISIIALRIKVEKRKPSFAEIKGLMGEQKVNDVLKQHNLIYFHDTLLKQGPVSSQFDHIIVFPNKTVVVIETKDRNGIITGGANDEKWLQVAGNQNCYYFYNPIKQNIGHINMLYNKMDEYHLYGYRILSLVVFTSDKSVLKDVPSGVIHLNDLSQTLSNISGKSFFNRSKKFVHMLKREDFSRSKKEVRRHKEFAKRAPHHKKATY
ncbi:nuclease-related domain-containing protein [Priestia megaterium]|uniref:nuclease-related domain-containing protein n=1 Tax=Priestia megaterium TaxID=1404 RepID=UPI0035DF6E03